jgi:hypothetical protein
MYNLKDRGTSFEAPKDGRYLLKIENVEVKPHTKDGKDGHDFGITFVSVDGKFKGKVWDHIYLPWANWKMATLLDAGGSKEGQNENATPTSIATALHGLEVSASLETTTGTNGKPRTNVGGYVATTEHIEAEPWAMPEKSTSDLGR